MAIEGFPQNIGCMASLQGNRGLCCQHFSTGPVNNHSKIYKAFSHRNVGRIKSTNLIRLANVFAAQQLGIDFMAGIFLPGSCLSEKRFNTHAFH